MATAEKERIEFDTVPDDRTFCTLKMFLDEDGDPTGCLMFHGDRLKALGVPRSKGAECQMIGQMIGQAAQKAVEIAGLMAEVAGPLVDALVHGHDEEGNCQVEATEEFIPDEVVTP